MVPWADTWLFDAKGIMMHHVDEEAGMYEHGLKLEAEAAAHAAAESHGQAMLEGYKAKAEECVHHEAADHFSSYQQQYLLSTKVATHNAVDNASTDSFTSMHLYAVEAANLDFNKFKHQLHIDTEKHKQHAASQVVSNAKAKTKSSVKAACKAKWVTLLSLKSTPSSSTPSLFSIPAAVQAVALLLENVTP